MGSRGRATVAALVAGGLIASMVAGVFLIERPAGDLPGVALGSETILVVERTLGLFAAWLFVVVVMSRASVGQLPSEISGRGVRYADRGTTQEALAEVRSTLERLDGEVEDLREVTYVKRKER
ncbi:MAG TPA: hypothetical protein VEW67_09290 [Thermoleophilaceae bacterium]|nr:hypothetical protein [Thermoleophilaceae bacterium]